MKKKYLGKFMVDDELEIGDEVWRITIEATNFYSDTKKFLEVALTDSDCRDWCMFIVPDTMPDKDIMKRIDFIRENIRNKIRCLEGYDEKFPVIYEKPLDNDAEGVILSTTELEKNSISF